jgi:ABC-type sugar transport system ATPase subunit
VSAEVTASPSDEVLFEARDVSEPGIVDGISFRLHKGEILGLFGLMGSGRTELARILFGLDPYQRGEMFVDGKALGKPNPQKCIDTGLAFITEDRHLEGLMMEQTIAENIDVAGLPQFSSGPLGVLQRERMKETVHKMADSLRIKSGDIDHNKAKSLSGGNQQKAVVAKWLLLQPKVLIMDEPTRGIDVGAKYELYTLIDELARGGSSVLFISSEIEELLSMCHRIMVMSRGELIGTFPREHFNKESILRAAFRQVTPSETEGMVEYA